MFEKLQNYFQTAWEAVHATAGSLIVEEPAAA